MVDSVFVSASDGLKWRFKGSILSAWRRAGRMDEGACMIREGTLTYLSDGLIRSHPSLFFPSAIIYLIFFQVASASPLTSIASHGTWCVYFISLGVGSHRLISHGCCPRIIITFVACSRASHHSPPTLTCHSLAPLQITFSWIFWSVLSLALSGSTCPVDRLNRSLIT